MASSAEAFTASALEFVVVIGVSLLALPVVAAVAGESAATARLATAISDKPNRFMGPLLPLESRTSGGGEQPGHRSQRSTSLPLPIDPLADVGRAVEQQHAIRLAPPHEANYVHIHES